MSNRSSKRHNKFAVCALFSILVLTCYPNSLTLAQSSCRERVSTTYRFSDPGVPFIECGAFPGTVTAATGGVGEVPIDVIYNGGILLADGSATYASVYRYEECGGTNFTPTITVHFTKPVSEVIYHINQSVAFWPPLGVDITATDNLGNTVHHYRVQTGPNTWEGRAERNGVLLAPGERPFPGPGVTDITFVNNFYKADGSWDFGISIFAFVQCYPADGAENFGKAACNASRGEPVNVTNGNMYLEQNDYSLPSAGPSLNVTRTYNSKSPNIGLFGRGWSSTYDESINIITPDYVRWLKPDGQATNFNGSSSFTAAEGDFHGSLVKNSGGSFTLTLSDGSVRQFNSGGKLTALIDRRGNQTTLNYDSNNRIASITDPFGRLLNVTTNSNGRVLSIYDTLGTIATYTYGSSNQLLSVIYADNSGFTFEYDGGLRLTTVYDALENVVEGHAYDAFGRAISSYRHGGVDGYTFNYVNATQTDVTDALGRTTKFTFNTSLARNAVTRVEGMCNCGGSQDQTWTYDDQLNVTSQSDALGHVTSFSHDADGNRLTEADATGTVTYTYNSFGQALTRTDQLNGVTTNTYDAQGNLLTNKDALNNTTTFTYDSRGQMLTATDARNKVTSFTWDSSGRLTQTKDALNNITNFGYDARARTTSVTNALNQTTSFNYDPAGRVNKITQPDGTFVAYTYDLAGRRTTVSDARNSVTPPPVCTNVALATSGSTVTASSSHSSGSYPASAVINGDRTGNTWGSGTGGWNDGTRAVYPDTLDVQFAAPESINQIKVFTLQNNWQNSGEPNDNTSASGEGILDFDVQYCTNCSTPVESWMTVPGGSVTGNDKALRVLSFPAVTTSKVRVIVNNSRNNWSRVVEIEAYRSDCSAPPTNIGATTYDYDFASRLISVTDAAGQTINYAYDQMSNLTTAIDALYRETNYEYDDFDRLVKITYSPAEDGATQLFQTISYDPAGNVTQRTDTAGRVTSYAYDNADRITSTTDADNKTTSFQYDALSRVTALTDALNQQYQFAFDALGRQTQMTRAGVSMSYQYDAVGNRTRRTDYNGAITNYTFDDLNRLTTIIYPDSTSVTYSYDALSRISSGTNSNGAVTFNYDNRDRVSNTTDVFNQTVGYSYDANSNRTAMTLNGAANASYTHDAVNRMTMVRDSTNLGFSFAYDAVNRLTSRAAPNGTTSNYAYDGLDRLTNLTHQRGATTLISNQYTHNSANNIASWTNNAGNHAYGYDPVDRLTSAANSVQPNENYSYDGVGNRTSSHLSVSYSYQPVNKLTSTTSATYTYDNNGNLISKTVSGGTTQFAWDFENRLKQVTLPNGNIVTYKYDALGRRIERSAGLPPPLPPTTTTRFIYDGADVIRDTNGAGVSTANYLNGPGIDNKLRQSVGVAGFYFLQDHIGSTQALADGNGNIVEQQQYDSFGNSAGSNFTRYGYTGRERDPDTGLLYYRARFYDPQVGRFISEDPIGFGGGINWFAYVGNNVPNGKDPSGLYNSDVHYYLTYFIASRFPCLTPEDARQIAEATQRVDEDPETEPGAGWNEGRRQINSDFHAFNPGNNANLTNLRNISFRRAGGYGDLGRYLHYLQDSYSHRGFGRASIGQAEALLGLNNPLAVDYTNENVGKGAEMAGATWFAIRDWIKAKKCECGDQGDTDVHKWWPQVIQFLETDNNQIERKRQILGIPPRR